MGIREKIKEIAPVYRAYQFFFRRKNFLHQKREILFYKKLIRKNAVVFDIGANIGHKTDLFLHLGARVVAIEPDLTNYRLLLSRFQKEEKVRILGLAVSDSVGEAAFFQKEPGSPFNTLSVKWKHVLESPSLNRWKEQMTFGDDVTVPTTTLDILISEYGRPDFIKIDVEGHELSCIKGLSERISIISFEANLPEGKTETIEILSLLRNINPSVRFNIMRDDEGFDWKETVSYEQARDFVVATPLPYLEFFAFNELLNSMDPQA